MTSAEVIARTIAPDLFSENPRVQHQAASPMILSMAQAQALERAQFIVDQLLGAGFVIVFLSENPRGEA